MRGGIGLSEAKPGIRKKLEVARQELLDLGLRNPLLNYRTLKARGLEIVRESPAEVYRMLVTEKRRMSFESIVPSADNAQGNSGIDAEEDRERGEVSYLTLDPVTEAKYYDSKLQTNYSLKALDNRLLSTYYYARAYIEEQGVNILHIALGTLRWFESDNSQEARKAPLLLVPIRLERVSARERFTIQYTEDEIGTNISLAAKLKAEFGLELPGVPEEGELDVKQYFSDVEKAVAGQRRWSVDRDSIAIGFFSFGKFLMYRDLDTAIWPDSLQPERHPVLTAILEDGFREEPSRIGEEERLDGHIRMEDAHHILDADSSQMTAILDAMQGRNLVIQGPPGTGKSQTITNLIAEAIGSGKKVLFVSEKMAALEVVKRRLDSLGLGVACLELHSHKTNKKALLQELASTLELGKPRLRDDGDIRSLEELRTRLNDYCDAVNEPIGETGVSPYAALGELVRYGTKRGNDGAAPYPKLDVPSVETWDPEAYRMRERLVEELQTMIAAMGAPAKHPFRGSARKAALPTEVERLKSAAREAADRIAELQAFATRVAAEAQLPAPTSLAEAEAVAGVLRRGANAPELDGIRIDSTKWREEAAAIAKLLEAGIAHKAIHDRYDAALIPEAWEQDLIEHRAPIVKYEGKWWGFLSGGYRRAKQRMLGLCRHSSASNHGLLDVLDAIMEARRLKRQLAEYDVLAAELFPAEWRGAESRWDRLSALIPWALELHGDVRAGKLPDWSLAAIPAIIDKRGAERLAEELERRTQEAFRAADAVEELLEYDGAGRFRNGEALVRQPFSDMEPLLRVWAEQASRLHEIVSFNHLSVQLGEAGLTAVGALAEAWEGAGARLVDTLRWNRFEAIAARAFEERAALASFDRNRHDHAVRKFQELDRYAAEYNRVKLADAHWRRLPKYEAGGQLGVLRREFEKKTRHLPIRQLMIRAGHAIQAIKPVFMMGPLSIAAYLEPGSLEFDLVVFDEASQVKPVDAFGAIIRGKQAVVVGDSRQMPPTNFFDSIAKEEEENEEHFASDMESILGLFVGQNAPQRMLRWHYRSRHESLITVSNHEFYENKLVVFPSPDADRNDTGLRYRYLPDSAYDRGRTRTNKEEAKAVARAVLEHAQRRPELTLGVAAFSIAQMQAILDEVELLRRQHAELDTYISAHGHEPFFVKNLENVQGDERDVIFISIGYGKTSEGYLAMDFGALNRDGGERRLNVLITRARMRCEVFTNLRADDIDLSRSGAQGVKSLKTFLKYAECGNLDAPAATGKDFDSPFEEAVYRALTDAGYEVRPQVGSAGFFVDLAVVDPESPGRFLLGIECDGASYHRARSARDRDRLRQQVLEGLGWTIHRIWSTDWFRHESRELKRTVERIEAAKAARLTTAPLRSLDAAPPSESDIPRYESAEKPEPAPIERYRAAELSIDLSGGELHAVPPSLLATWVQQVVSAESPVHVSEVLKRICDAAGVKRAGSRIQEAIVGAIPLNRNVVRRGDFLWRGDMCVPPIRDRSEWKAKKPELIANEEVAEAIVKAVRDSFGAEEHAAIAAAVQSLGFSRVTEELRVFAQPIVEALLEEGRLLRKGSTLVSKE